MEIIMNIDKVSQEFRTLIEGECFYDGKELFMKVSHYKAFNFDEGELVDYGEHDIVQYVISKLLIG